MKKLTAGIFTVLLGLVTVNAADAAVASKLYVDQEVGGVATGLSNYVTSNDSRVLTVEGKVTTLQGQVADETNGLIKKVADLRTEMDNVKGGQLNITDGAVTDAKLAADAVTTAKIADANVTAAKLAEGAAVTNIGYTPEDVANKTATIDANSTADQYPTAKAVYDQFDQVQKDVGDNLTLIQELQTKSATKTELAQYQQSNGAAVQANADAIKTINESDAMTSGVTAAIVGTVKTNANNIGAIAQSDYIQSLEEGNRTLTGAVNALAENLETARDASRGEAEYAMNKAVAYTDSVVNALHLKEISRVPAACSEPNKYCALTTNGSQFVWEVIERAEGETVTPAQGSVYPLTDLTAGTVVKPSGVPAGGVEPK